MPKQLNETKKQQKHRFPFKKNRDKVNNTHTGVAIIIIPNNNRKTRLKTKVLTPRAAQGEPEPMDK